MLAILAIAFGKDTAMATVISLEPFLEAAQPSLTKQVAAAVPSPPPPPPPPLQPPPQDKSGDDALLGKGDRNDVAGPRQGISQAAAGSTTAAAEAAVAVRKKSGGSSQGDLTALWIRVRR